jgi:hypothetical protein
MTEGTSQVRCTLETLDSTTIVKDTMPIDIRARLNE